MIEGRKRRSDGETVLFGCGSLLLVVLLLGLTLGERRDGVLLGAAFGLRRRNGTASLHHLESRKMGALNTGSTQASLSLIIRVFCMGYITGALGGLC